MSGRPALDPRGRVGRALFMLVDSTLKSNNEIKARVARIRNIVESNLEDPGVAGKVEGDFSILMRDPKLNPHVRMLRKALRAGVDG